jgi:hypothetical protein
MVRVRLVVVLLLAGCPTESTPPTVDAAAPDVIHCTADCECRGYGLSCTYPGVCGVQGAPDIGVCGLPGWDCPCVGGTCDERHCCVLPDGGIDPGSGPACDPPIDAGPTSG